MKGNNAIKDLSPEERTKFELVRDVIESCLTLMLNMGEDESPNDRVKYDEKDRTFKVHKQELNTDDIIGLAGLAKSALNSKITIKRSGTGVTIIVKLVGKEETGSTPGATV